MSAASTKDLRHLVVLPQEPGPIVRLADMDPSRSDVDEALDDMFGEVDSDGPGATDIVLLGGGAAAVVATQIVSLPAAVLFGGIAGLGLGAVIPIRSALRWLKQRRRGSKVEAAIATGHLLDTRHELVRELITIHAQLFDAASRLNAVHALRSRNAAHALVGEVATLLEGHRLTDASEIAYCTMRRDALRDLLAAVIETVNHSDDRNAAGQVSARLEVESSASTSALHESDELTADLRLGNND